MSQTLNRSLAPLVVSVATGSPAESVGVMAGDEIVRVNGQVPRDIIEWQMSTDEAEVELDVLRGGLDRSHTFEEVTDIVVEPFDGKP